LTHKGTEHTVVNFTIDGLRMQDYLVTSVVASPASLYVSGNIINTVKCFKLLGICISDDLH